MKKLQKLFASSPQGLILTNSMGVITDWNQAAENIFGWRSREAVGMSLDRIIAEQCPEILARWREWDNIGDLPTQGKVGSSTGEPHLVEFLIGCSEEDELGEVFRLIIANDISHQWYREKQLQEALSLQAVMNTLLHVAMLDQPLDQQLQLLLELILATPTLPLLPRGAILISDTDSQQLLLKTHKGLAAAHLNACGVVPMGECYCGRAALQGVVSYEENFVLPSAWAEAPCRQLYPRETHYSIPIRSEERVLGVLVLFLERALPGQNPAELETMLAMANVLAAVLDREVLRREQGKLIDHLRAFNKNLRDEKKFSESIIASLFNGLLILDNDERVAAANPEGCRLLGQFFPGELLGRRLKEIVGELLAEVLLVDAEASGCPSSGPRKTLALTSSSGEARLIEYVTSPRVDTDGLRLGSIICLSDITEADRLHKKMEKMNRFGTIAEIASAVAHEVRNPLTGIKAISQGVESQLDPTDRNREHLRRIINQVDRLNILLNDFFTYARPTRPFKKAVGIREIFDLVLPLLQARAEKNGVIIVNRLADNLPQVVVDPQQMQQVFLNILLNDLDAIKGQGQIEITAEDLGLARNGYDERRFPGLPRDRPYLMVQISDSGEGMAAEIQDKVFEPFFTTKTTGTGLGLAIVMRIIREHEAHLYVESEPKQGTSFFLFFRTDC